VLHVIPIILTSFGEERNLRIAALQWNTREAKVKFVPLFSQRTNKTFCVQDGGRTVPRITVGFGRNCAQLHAPAAVSLDKRLGDPDSRPGGREEKTNLNYSGYCEYNEPGYTGRCYSWNFTTALNLVKPSDQFNIQQFCVLPTRCIFVFCVAGRTNSDYFPTQHYVTGFHNRVYCSVQTEFILTPQIPVVTTCTTSSSFNNSTFRPLSVFICFVWISEQTAFIPLYNIKWLVFITETESVYCAVR